MISSCWLDGIAYVGGYYTMQGNGAVYGSLITHTTSSSGSIVYYNSRLKTEGISVAVVGPFISTKGGFWADKSTWGGIGVPDTGSSVTVSAGHSVYFYGSVSGVRSITNRGQLIIDGEMGIKDGGSIGKAV